MKIIGNNKIIVLTKLFEHRLVICRTYITACWEYTGCKNAKGYGVIRIFSSNYLVHKLSASLYIEDYNDKLFTLHKCNNPACFRPEHLYQGSNRQNMLDAVNNKTHTQSKKEFCPRGHPYNEINTIIRTDKRGRKGRWCKQCEKDRIRS